MFIVKEDGGSAAVLGVITAIGGVGGMVGALTASRWLRRLSMRALLVGGFTAWALTVVSVEFVSDPIGLGVAFASRVSFRCPLYDEHVAVILVTGMSGTGKSTALGRLEQRGYRVVDTDFGGWIEEVPRPDGTGTERQWREDRIDALIADHERSGEPLFIAGTVWNQGGFHSRFDEIVLLSAPLAVMLDRIADRDTNAFGKTAEERERIMADTAGIEPLLRSSATLEIDTRKPLAEVVDRLAALAGPPPTTDRSDHTIRLSY